MYDCTKIPKRSGMENITTEEVMNNLDIFQARFLKVNGFVWCYIERIKTYFGAQFTSKEFQEGLSVRRVRLALLAPDHQEINVQVEVILRMLQTIAHSIMVHAQVLENIDILN